MRPVGLEGYFSNFAGSNPLAVLRLDLAGGARLPVVWKDLSPASAMPHRTPKPGLVTDPGREPLTYAELLASADVGTADCYGIDHDPGRGRHWLFMEAVPGVRLPEAADPDAWIAAAECLAKLHLTLARRARLGGLRVPLVRYDARHLWRWMDRALERTAGSSAEAHVQRLAARYGATVDRITAVPSTIIHGEFYPVNIVVSETGGKVGRVCAVDWETTGIGPGWLDVAALTSGAWSAEERARVVAAYLGATLDRRPDDQELATVIETVEHCRIHLCVQWIGWSPGWSAPADQAHDWLEEALRLSGQLSRSPGRRATTRTRA
jgi:aminoglycoside phosphotransferase (APT) family kinase protein